MRRLYVGGLSHLITEKDLKDRFGKFGNVEDVELRTRRDEDGVPYKTFGYVNIDISDADLKKCLTVLNKSKWKGGILQIETAKESFLHRLAQERQAAAEQCPKQPEAEDKCQKLLNSLSKAGVDNFTMKAAVPGTEIPGHKDWIVSKFGRVLPVLQLRCQKGNKARTIKYDPSKYCHNIRKLDRDATMEPIPVTQLTWEVKGADDDISKKRRGEFPPYQPPRPKKNRTNVVNSCDTVAITKPGQIVESVSSTKNHFANGFVQSTNHRRGAYLNDSDVDSDEEIRRLVAIQQMSHSALQQVSEEDNLEVVGFDYLVKSGKKGMSEDENEDDYDSADTDELFASRKPPPPPPQKKSTPLMAEQVSENNTDRKRKTKRKSKDGGREEDEEGSSRAKEHLTCRKLSTTAQRGDAAKQNCQKKGDSSENQSNKMVELPLSESDGDDEDEEEEELDSADSSLDSDYEGMFSNVTHLEISLADLQKLAEENNKTSETTAPSILSTSLKQKSNFKSGPTEEPAPRKGILPEDILAAILEDNSSGDEQQRKKRKRKGAISTSLPAFQGTGALNQGSNDFIKAQDEEDGRGAVKKQKPGSEAQLNRRATTSRIRSQLKHTETKKTSDSSEEDDEEDEEEQKRKQDIVKNMAPTQGCKKAPEKDKTVSSFSSGSDDDDDDDEEEETKKSLQTVQAKASFSSSSSSSEEDEEKPAEDSVAAAPFAAPDSESSCSEEDEKEEQSLPRMPLKAEDEQEQQRKANLRRLAAVQQRQKEAEEHKKLIQGALANPDAPKPGAGKHIVFGSDDDEDEDQTTSEVSSSRKTVLQGGQSEDESTSEEEGSSNESSTNKEKEHLKPSGPQLFGGSDAEDDGDEEEDGGRFDIRPQFEGRAGQKLMELQSRFGTDERFRMDSRFLEDGEKESEESEKKESLTEDDEALEQERKKNLDILQSVLGSSQHACSKTSSKAKTFRDVSNLHYDPSKEEHAAFETTTDKTKESKSARRKKREAAQKLPEVSKEIYFEVSSDLTTVFGPSKNDATGQEENTTWDQEEEQEDGGQDEEPTSCVLTADPSAGKEESTGFKFSFFGDDTETENKLTEAEYKVESIQASKASWQQDPRFHDSSSDEDEEEQDEEEEQTSTTTKMREEETPSKVDLFFFHPEDSRLTEGPRLFCRSSQLEEQRDQWEERRNELRQEYRKKHKNARRKLKSTQKC